MLQSQTIGRGFAGGFALALALAAGPALAGTYTVLHQFSGRGDGAQSGPVTLDSAGNLYGETSGGESAGGSGCGGIYRIDPAGVFSTIVAFPGQPSACAGRSGLLISGDTLYGATAGGGEFNDGVLFSISTSSPTLRVLHQFSGTDGAFPIGTLRAGPRNVLYGITQSGGTANQGVLFEMKADGTYAVLHDFDGVADGGSPNAIVVNAAGTIFGSAATSIQGCSGSSCGVVFAYVPSTGVFSVLHTFTGGGGGAYPYLGSVAANGELFGATAYGGKYLKGSLFRLIEQGGVYNYNHLYDFTGVMQGVGPSAGPAIQDNAALVGVTGNGGTNSAGTLYSLSAAGLTTLVSFPHATGGDPNTQPILNGADTVFGTTEEGRKCTIDGNPSLCGTVYSYTP